MKLRYWFPTLLEMAALLYFLLWATFWDSITWAVVHFVRKYW